LTFTVASPIKRVAEEPSQGQGAGSPLPPIVLKEVYEQRFDEADQAAKEAIWHELGRFLQRFIVPNARVVDIACDLGYFIRNVKAEDRWATDIRDVESALPKDVHFVRASGLELADVMPNDHFDLAFFSNYLEHLPSTEAVLQQLRVTFSLLKPGGRGSSCSRTSG
jgi:ubiquinone/menaquinone biosynthesis C-methylase UbiE